MNSLLAGNSYLEIDSSSLKYVDSTSTFNSIPIIALNAFDYLRSAEKTEGITRFIFVRHGESTSNAEKSIAGRKLDVDLSERGKQQVIKVSKQLNETLLPIDIVYSSPSLRAYRTAELLVNPPHICLDERLYEKFYGPYEGASEKDYQPLKKIDELENSGPAKSFIDKFGFKGHPEMESMAEVYHRSLDFLEEVHQKHQGKNLVVTTHNGVMKALFMVAAAFQGFDVDYRSFDLENASILIIEVENSEIRVLAASGLKYRDQ